MEFFDQEENACNVNFIRRQPQRASSIGNLTNSSFSDFDGTNVSLPFSDGVADQSEEETKVTQLETQLLSANKQIDDLLLENGQMKKELDKKQKLIDMYKKIDYGDIQGSPLLGRKRKRTRAAPGLVLGTPKASSSADRQQIIFERQQEKIDDLNSQILQLQQWLKEEKEKNEKTEADRKQIKKSSAKYKKYATKSRQKSREAMVKKIKQLSKSIIKLEKECIAIRRENEQLKHTVTECTLKNKILQQKIEQHKSPYINNENKSEGKRNQHENYNKSTNTRKTVIFSDITGKGIASTLTNNMIRNSIINYCQPGATYDKILENFYAKTRLLNREDTVVIIINKFEESLKRKEGYVKIIKDITDNQDRTYNVIICGIKYDQRNDMDIYALNKEIALIANMTKNVKYIDTNMTNNQGRPHSHKRSKKLLFDTIASLITANVFQGTSSLQFIECRAKHNTSPLGNETIFCEINPNIKIS